MAETFLDSINFLKEEVRLVHYEIINHNNCSYGKQKTLEAKILYDADKLDVVGVMGICRTLICVGNYNKQLYVLIIGKIDMNENCDTDTFVRYYLSHIQKTMMDFIPKQQRLLHKSKRILMSNSLMHSLSILMIKHVSFLIYMITLIEKFISKI